MAGEGFEPSKAEPGDLQSPPIGRSGNPPGSYIYGGRKITSTLIEEVIAYFSARTFLKNHHPPIAVSAMRVK
ncbi:MAG: hypothetical protein RL144_1008 [Actinomycetota bacterium]